MKLSSFLEPFIGKSSDDLIQVKDAEETLTREDFIGMAKMAAEQKAQMQLEYTKQMAKIDAAAALGLANQQASLAQGRHQWVPPGTLGSPGGIPGPSLPPGPGQQWPPGGTIPTPPQGIINKLFGDKVPDDVHLSKAEFDERLAESWRDGYEEGYDDAETYCMEKDEAEAEGQWGTFADAVKAAGVSPILAGTLGVHKGVTFFDSKGVSGGESLEGNEEQFTLAHIDKAVEAAKAVTPGQVINWQPAENGGEFGFTRGLATHYKAAQLEENAKRSEEMHEMLGAGKLPPRGWADGVDGELSPSVGNRAGHSEEGEGELLRERIYEEAQEVAEAEAEGNETDE